jgi:hypothetical protein
MNKNEKQFIDNLAKTKQLPWEDFDNINSASIPKVLNDVQILEKNSEGSYDEQPSLFINNGISSIAVTTKISSRSSVAILDFLYGTIIKQDNHIILTRNNQFYVLSELELGKHYKLRKGNDFSASEVIDIINFIHSHIMIVPPKFIKNFIIAGADFQIDFENMEVTNESIKENETYFKHFNRNFKEVEALIPKYQQFLEMVINDEDSLHNARLQPVYTMLVAMRLISKTRFFISKSGVRTGKGLRHSIISSIFNTKHVSLDGLNGMTSDLAWASFDGGELLLVTESGAITPSQERHLKVLATETVRSARGIGENYANINLTGVLTIDSNEKIYLSPDMNSRVVNIAFRNRPKSENDSERENIFAPFWEAFTTPSKLQVTPKAITEAGLAALLDSFYYWKENNYKFDFHNVEMDNFETGDFDDVQLLIIETILETKTDFVIKSGNDNLHTLLNTTYQGVNKTERRKSALAQIGTHETIIKPNSESKSVRVIKIINQQRFDKAVEAYKKLTL